MRVRIRSISGATPVLDRPVVIAQGEPYVEVADLADLWVLRAEIEGNHLIAIDTYGDEQVLLVIDDYLD